MRERASCHDLHWTTGGSGGPKSEAGEVRGGRQTGRELEALIGLLSGEVRGVPHAAPF